MFNIGGKKRKNIGDYGLDAMMPFTKVTLVTPDDNTNNCEGSRGLWIGVAGTLDFIGLDSETVEGFPAVVGYNPIICVRILTSSTADNIWAGF